MNKLFQKFAICLLAGSILSVWTSCDDDDDNVTPPNSEFGEIVPGSGEKLLSVGNFRFFYTADGQLSHSRNGNIRYEFSDNQIFCDYYYYYTDDPTFKDTITATYTLNKKGYVTKLVSTEVWGPVENFDYIHNDAVNTYDKEGHLIKIERNSSENYIEDGNRLYATGVNTLTLTWDDGLLTNIKNESVWDDGYTSNHTFIFNYGNKEYPNPHRQYATFMYGFFNNISLICSWMGLYGEGPDYLPVSIEIQSKDIIDGEEFEYCDTIHYAYEFNADGTIRNVNNTKNFTYGPISEQGTDKDYTASFTRSSAKPQNTAPFSLFTRRKRN